MSLETKTPAKPTKRRWFQFRLRTLIVVVGLLCAGLAFLAHKMHQARLQREALEVFERAGGFWRYPFEDEIAGFGSRSPLQPPLPASLVEFFGIDFFYDIHELHFLPLFALRPKKSLTDDDLVHLAALSQLETLDLYGCESVTDVGIVHVAKLTSVRNLDLCGTHVTGEGILLLSQLPNLHKLTLDKTLVTTPGAAKLRTLRPNLTVEGR